MTRYLGEIRIQGRHQDQKPATQTLPTAPGSDDPTIPPNALRRIRLGFIFLVGIAAGFAWDRSWHTTHPFESFYSPPHIFIYTMVFCTGVTVVSAVFSPRLHRAYGSGLRLNWLPYETSGALLIALCGVATMGAAGLLDDLWHSTFGLDETSWSFPHVMLGWGILLIFLGLVACRMALQSYRPWAWYTCLFCGIVALSFPTEVLLGPLFHNTTAGLVRRIAALPVLVQSLPYQHTTRIYLAWDLNRTNPLFVPLAAATCGVGLALVRRFGYLFLTTSLATIITTLDGLGVARHFGLTHDPRSWLPLPFLPAAIAFIVLGGTGLSERWRWVVAGLVFGLFATRFWGTPAWLALLAAPLMEVGAAIGGLLYAVLTHPTRRNVAWLAAIAALVISLVLGSLDLLLRTHTA